MRVFLTGGTGYIGQAVARALRTAGHEVVALARPSADTKTLRGLGVLVMSGDLESLPSLRGGLDGFDAFVHTAKSGSNTVAADHAAIDTFTSLPGHFVYTSGVWSLGNTTEADEASPVNPLEISAWRPPHEELVLGAGGAVIRPGCVYGGRQDMFAGWFAAADQGRPLEIVGDGTNRWALVDLDELADLYVRVVEQEASGVLHGVDDSDSTLLECARLIAPEGKIEHVPLDVARKTMGDLADALAVNQLISSTTTRNMTFWNPWRTFRSTIADQWRVWREQQ